jgi:hypothetical protein
MIRKFVVAMMALMLMIVLMSNVYAGPPVKTVKWSATVEQVYCPPVQPVYVCVPVVVAPQPALCCAPRPLDRPCIRCIKKLVSCPFRILDAIFGG